MEHSLHDLLHAIANAGTIFTVGTAVARTRLFLWLRFDLVIAPIVIGAAFSLVPPVAVLAILGLIR